MMLRKEDDLKIEVAPEVMGDVSADSSVVNATDDDQSSVSGPNGSDGGNATETPVKTPESEQTPNEDHRDDSEARGPENGTQDVSGGTEGETAPEDESKTFPKPYVDKLRKEAADNRAKAKRTDDLAARLHTSLVASTGKLADPTDLPFDEAHLDDPEALDAAIEELIAAKPHLASRTPRGDIGQGISGKAEDDFSLAGWLGGMTR